MDFREVLTDCPKYLADVIAERGKGWEFLHLNAEMSFPPKQAEEGRRDLSRRKVMMADGANGSHGRTWCQF